MEDQRSPRLLLRKPVPGDGAGRGPELHPQADELPVPHPDLQVEKPQLPRAPAAVLRAWDRLPLRAVRGGAWVAPEPWLHPGRRPHLRERGRGGRRAGAAPRLRAHGAARLWLRGIRSRSIDPGSGALDRRPRPVGHRRGRIGRGATEGRAAVRGRRWRGCVLRPQDRYPCS